jgi:PAS domain S-box-containing protein
MMERKSWKPWLFGLESLVVAAVYFAAGKAGLAVPFTNGSVSPVWPAAGVALGAMLIFGRRAWLGIVVGDFLVNLSTQSSPIACVAIAISTVLGSAISAQLLAGKSFTKIRRFNDVVHLLSYGALGLIMPALIGPAALFLTGTHAWDHLPWAWLVWWLGDCLGVLLVVPLIVNFSDLKALKPRLAELSLLLLWLLVCSAALFHQSRFTEDIFVLALLPFVIWGAVRFTIAGAALANCTVAAVAIWETAKGAGPFVANGSPFDNAGILQAFIGVLTLSGLSLAALIAERTTAQEALAREERLRRAQEQYRMIVETTNEGVWVIDGGYKTTFVNKRTAEMLGYTPQEMEGRGLFEFLFPEDAARKLEDLRQRQQGFKAVMYDRVRRKDGSELWVLVSTAPMFSEKGQFTGVLGMLTDVTLLRKTEETLRRNEKLITAGRLAATISHEVNNPLEAVVNLLFLLKTQPMSEQARQYVETAEKEIYRISAITKRTLGFFRDNSAHEELPIADLLNDTLSFYEEKLAARSICVKKEYASRGVVRASRGEMQQVFANLISNALDAMSQDGVLTLRVNDVAGRKGRGIQVEIEDTGTGIAEADLGRVFEPFFTTKADTGTGLGLWVAKEIVQKHGGSIAVTSQSGSNGGHGTQLSILLPASDGRAEPLALASGS